MGTFTVRARVWNIHNPAKAVEVDLLVDAGATYTVMPAELLESLGVSAVRVARLRLADGRVVERRVGEVGIDVEGFRASATPVVFGDRDIYLLGSVTMEQLGLAPDPAEKRLKPVEALLMGIYGGSIRVETVR
ncbi:MAG: aspartyl protease family protein [Pyrobaculum sp.]